MLLSRPHLFTLYALAISVLASMAPHRTLAQDDLETLALQVSKAEASNLEKLKAYIWKRQSETYVSEELKATLLMECKFDTAGKLVLTPIDAKSTVQQKPGIRGRMQQNAMEENMDYVGKALDLSANYIYMSKGQLLDFFSRSKLTTLENGTLVVTGSDVYVKGDQLIVHVDPVTHLFLYKGFTTKLGEDAISGSAEYRTFTSSSVSHVDKTTLLLPAKKARIMATNKDYSQRVN
ncbi:MAG: hypothetical protein JNL05_15915 [Flavobacteriales bacterium]|nr:hypothetical protein [Flavobacteriales bacterium]